VVLGSLVSFEAVLLLPSAVQIIGTNLEAAHRIYALIDVNVDDEADLKNVSKLIPEINTVNVSGLSFRYTENDPEVIKEINFEITQGKRVGLVGVSGVGKSTLLNLLLSHWRSFSGEILVNGDDIRIYNPEEIRKEISVISQTVYLFNTSIRENLRVGKPEASEEELIEAAKVSGAHEFILELPLGYDTIVGERGANLSGGEIQRIGIARALLKDASLYLMDEPLAHLDVISHKKIMTAMLEFLKDKSILLITHQKFGLQEMDEIIVLDGGSIVEKGKYSELMNAGGVFSSMWVNLNDKISDS
jgi:ATP-binding cassette subfamily C protein CydC